MVRVSDEEVKKTHGDIGPDEETLAVTSFVNGCPPSEILEIGCGPVKTVDGSVGLDATVKGEENPYRKGACIADIVHDLDVLPIPVKDETFTTVIGRHILEGSHPFI